MSASVRLTPFDSRSRQRSRDRPADPRSCVRLRGGEKAHATLPACPAGGRHIHPDTAVQAVHAYPGAGAVIAPAAAIHHPVTVGEAVEILATVPEADLLAGGTDLVPALSAGTRSTQGIVALRRVLELRVRGASADTLTVGAGVTYTELAGWSLAPGLAATARVVGSPQIRNSGTVGGALGTASPRGDLLTFLAAVEAEVLLAGPSGQHYEPLTEFLGHGRRFAEIITAVRLPRPAGPQVYLKIGGRQAAYASVVSCAFIVDRVRHRVTCALGGVAATPLRPLTAEGFAVSEIDWAAGAAPEPVARRFAELVAGAVTAVEEPLPEDPRLPLAYRRHAAQVLAARAFARCLPPPGGGTPPADVPPTAGGAANVGHSDDAVTP
jgi:CO/xanthine dehydrogenase FAD-binding subunit